MNCPYCEKEMQKGVIQPGNLIDLFWGGADSMAWVAEEERDKMLPKSIVHLKMDAEGYYCEGCGKVVAIFEKMGDRFW